jgi:hypothetical protein
MQNSRPFVVVFCKVIVTKLLLFLWTVPLVVDVVGLPVAVFRFRLRLVVGRRQEPAPQEPALESAAAPGSNVMII